MIKSSWFSKFWPGANTTPGANIMGPFEKSCTASKVWPWINGWPGMKIWPAPKFCGSKWLKLIVVPTAYVTGVSKSASSQVLSSVAQSMTPSEFLSVNKMSLYCWPAFTAEKSAYSIVLVV